MLELDCQRREHFLVEGIHDLRQPALGPQCRVHKGKETMCSFACQAVEEFIF